MHRLKVCQDFLQIIMHLRFHMHVLIADIEKMYCQFSVLEEDRKYQKIIYQEDNQINKYCLNTVTFALASAAFLVIRCLHQVVKGEGHVFLNKKLIIFYSSFIIFNIFDHRFLNF